MTDTKDDFMAFMDMVKEESTKDTEVEKKMNLLAKAVSSKVEEKADPIKTGVKVEKKSFEPAILEEDTVAFKEVKTETKTNTTDTKKEPESKTEEEKEEQVKEPIPDPTLDEFYSEVIEIG